MRLPFIACLVGSLITLAGCNPSPTTPPNFYYPKPDLPAVAAQFKDDAKPNKDVSENQIPLQYTDMNGKSVDLASYHGKAHVVLVVVKGMPKYPGGIFCPGCLAQVNSLTANYDDFKKRDAEIVMVFPGPSDKLPQFLADGKVDGENGNPTVPFSLVLDQDLKVVNALGIPGDLAKPSTYILDKKGKAVFAFVGETTTDRPSVKALLTQLDKLNTKK